MARFIKGDVVIVPFPFSDLSTVKRRPALVVAQAEGEDVILCAITSRSGKDGNVISRIHTPPEGKGSHHQQER